MRNFSGENKSSRQALYKEQPPLRSASLLKLYLPRKMLRFNRWAALGCLVLLFVNEACCGRTIIVTKENKPNAFKAGEGADMLSLLRQTEVYRRERGGAVLQSSFDGDTDMPVSRRHKNFVAAGNGFVDAVVRAYNEHYDLIIRPDDVWIAIMTQFAMYVNGHAEELRSQFVTFDGQRELVANLTGSVRTADYVSMIDQFTELIGENLKDDSVRDWVIANFSTTTATDRIVSQVVLVGAMQKYFRYIAQIACGIPKITIQGTREDWAKIKRRVARLALYGENCRKWSAMLDAILNEFVSVFDEPYNGTAGEPRNLLFWQSITQKKRVGCGTEALTGWITAFSVFDERGTWRGDDEPMEAVNGGTAWPAVDMELISPGYVSMPVIICDYGIKYQAQLFAGHLAFSHRAVKRRPSGARHSGSCLRPRAVWAIALTNDSRPDGQCL